MSALIDVGDIGAASGLGGRGKRIGLLATKNAWVGCGTPSFHSLSSHWLKVQLVRFVYLRLIGRSSLVPIVPLNVDNAF